MGAQTDVLAPSELILPVKTNVTASTANRVGTLFVSGGYLHLVSGSTLIRFSGAVLAT